MITIQSSTQKHASNKKAYSKLLKELASQWEVQELECSALCARGFPDAQEYSPYALAFL
jgi:hypothetical protein